MTHDIPRTFFNATIIYLFMVFSGCSAANHKASFEKPGHMKFGPESVTTEFEQVQIFQRKAVFLAKDSHLRKLFTNQAGNPEVIFNVPGNSQYNSQLAAVPAKSSCIVANGNTIYSVQFDGEATAIFSLEKNCPRIADNLSMDDLHINWAISASDDLTRLFFILISRKNDDFICRYDLTTESFTAIPHSHPYGIEFDTEKDIAYSPMKKSKSIGVFDLVSSTVKLISVSANYDMVSLTPDGSQLILSADPLSQGKRIGILNLDTGKEWISPIQGSLAVAIDSERFVFRKGENSLWIYSPEYPEGENLFCLEGFSLERKSFAKSPKISRDGTWIAWSWVLNTANDEKWEGTMLIDFQNRQYRMIPHYYPNVVWAQAIVSK